jgi:peroxiredoxin
VVVLSALSALLSAGCGPGSGVSVGTGDDVGTADRSISVRSLEPSSVYTDPAELVSLPPAESSEGALPGDADGPVLDNAFRLVGRTPSIWLLDEWANGSRVRWNELRGNAVVVRFFKLDSESCARTMAALEKLHQEFRACGVLFIGIFYPGSYQRGPEWDVVVDQAREWGVTFPIARDDRGITLRRWWQDYFQGMPETPTFVIGPDGRIVYVHPGPEFHPSEELLFTLCDRDYRTVRLAIQTALPRDIAQRP